MHLSTLSKISSHPRYKEHLEYVKSVGSYDPKFFSASVGGGYNLQQVPEEFAAFLTYVETNIKVKRYLEIGSASGGFMRCIHERLGFDEAVSVCDGKWQGEQHETNRWAFKEKVKSLTADSHSSEALEHIAQSYGDPYDLICIDGDHSYSGVIQDLSMVLQFCHENTLIMFHDVHASEEAPEVGPAVWSKMGVYGPLRLVANFFKREGVYTPLGIAVCKRVNGG